MSKAAATALTLTNDASVVDSLRNVINSQRTFFNFNPEVEGRVIVAHKKAKKVTLSQYRSFITATSPELWAPYITPTNLLYANVEEGTYVYAVFEVEGYPASAKLLKEVPSEVMNRLLPPLYAKVKADPAAFDLPVDTDNNTKNKRNALRVETLGWVPKRCSEVRSGTTRAVKPSHEKNGFSKLDEQQTKYFAALKRELDSPINRKRFVEDTTIPSFLELVRPGAVGLLKNEEWKMAIDGSDQIQVYATDGKLFLTSYKKQNTGEGASGASGSGEDAEDADDATD
jgi:hypothetical protein